MTQQAATVASHPLPSQPAFNLQHAVHVAAYAFSAYLEPVEARALHELSPDNAAAAGGIGTETQYFSRSFITQHFEAAVTVTVQSAEDLSASLASAYKSLEVTCGHSFGHTRIWADWPAVALGDEFTLWPRHAVPDDHTLSVSLLTHGNNDRKGGVVVASARLPLPPLDALADTTHKIMWWGVDDGEPVGKIVLKLHVAPFRGSAAGQHDTLSVVENAQLAMKTAGDGQHAVWGAQRDAAGDVPERGDVVDAVGVPDGVYSLGKRDLLRGAWRALRPVLPEGPYTDLQRVAFIDQRASDTQVWLSCDPATKQIVVAFRGTQLYKVRDLLANADIRQHTLSRPSGHGGTWALDGDAPAVHKGYHTVVQTALPKIGELVDMCTGGDASWRVTATGHSLGGATATVFAYLFATREGTRYPTSLINFGSLRVGNAAFRAAFSEWVPEAWRVEAEGDIFAYVPRSMGYQHVQNGVRLLANGQLGMLDRGDVEFGALAPAEAAEHVRAPPQVVARNGFWTSMRTNATVLRLALFGTGGLAHEEQTYLRRLVGIVRDVVRAEAGDEDRRIEAGLTEAFQLLERYGEAE